MTVSKREFFDMAYWKNKRYSTVIYQAGKNPADFEVVEAQDIANYELQQAVSSIMKYGCIADSFAVRALVTPTANKVRIYQGRAYAQSFYDGSEFSGIRIDMPDVFTTFPSLTYEHAVDINGYYEYDFTAEQTLIPPAGSYRYDLIYLEFWRKEYTPAMDSEIQDPVLSETALREKWFYTFHFYQGNDVNKNPDIPALNTGHHGMKLAVIKRMNTQIVSPESIIDVRPKFSAGTNSTGVNAVTVGAVGGNYETLYDVIASRIDANAITPTADNPYTVMIQPGVYSCPFQFNIGTLGHIRVVGSGIDKTILEFEDLYSLGLTEWINIGASPGIEFSDMTIRFVSGYSGAGKLIAINGGTVKLTNCKIGQVKAGMDFGSISVVNGNLTIKDSEVESRSSTVACIHLSGTSMVNIYDSIIRQSGYMVIKNECLTVGMFNIWNTQATGNGDILYLNGYSEVRNCLISKNGWFAGDVLTSGNTISITAKSKVFSSTIVGTASNNSVEIGTDAEFHDCTHNGVLTIDSAGVAKFFACSLRNVVILNTTHPEFYNCEFVDSSDVTVTMTSVTLAKFMDSIFKRDEECITATNANFVILSCHFSTTQAVNLVTLDGTCEPHIQSSQFHIENAGAVGIMMDADTATPVVVDCLFLGHASALMFDAASATTIKAASIAGDTTLKGANVTITDIQKAL